MRLAWALALGRAVRGRHPHMVGGRSATRTRSLLLLALAAAGLQGAPAPPKLPPRAQELAARLPVARAAYDKARGQLSSSQERARPVQEAVDSLKGEFGLWARWRLRWAMADLKERLDELQAAETAERSARDILFLILTGLEEETAASLEACLERRPLDKAQARALHEQLRDWRGQVEGLGGRAGEGGLIQIPAPQAGAGPEYWRGRLEALEAREVQLEALAAQVERDTGLAQRLARAGLVAPEQAASEGRALEARARELEALLKANTRELGLARRRLRP